MIFIYLYRMPNDISNSLGVPIISGLIETIDALKEKRKIVATYQICIDILFKFSDIKEATVILADGSSLTINGKNKISLYNILKKNKNAFINVKSMNEKDIDSIQDFAIKDSIMATKSYFTSKFIDKSKDKVMEDIITELGKTHSSKSIRSELDIVYKIISENNLGSIKSLKFTIDNKTTECSTDKDIMNFCKVLTSIILPGNEILSLKELAWENSKNMSYEILLSDDNKLIRNNDGEYTIE